jgi:hypothetical protein
MHQMTPAFDTLLRRQVRSAAHDSIRERCRAISAAALRLEALLGEHAGPW